MLLFPYEPLFLIGTVITGTEISLLFVKVYFHFLTLFTCSQLMIILFKKYIKFNVMKNAENLKKNHNNMKVQ